MSKEDALHGYCVYTVIKKRGEGQRTAKETKLYKKKNKKIRRQIKTKAHRENKYINNCGEKKGTGEQFQRRHAKKRRMLNMQTTVRGQS